MHIWYNVSNTRRSTTDDKVKTAKEKKMGSIDIIIGNLCSLCAMITDSISGTRKTRSQILGIQIISRLFYVVGTIVLKGYSATVQNSVAILRNIAAIKRI